eukprot:2293090-Heterocapsa_arctica.AAC.1
MKADEAQYIMSNTLDACDSLTFKKGQVLILDEFSPSDSISQIYMSADTMKSLLSPMMSCSLRARNKNTEIAQG